MLTGSRMDYAKLHAVASMFTIVAYGNIMRSSKKALLHAVQRQTEPNNSTFFGTLHAR